VYVIGDLQGQVHVLYNLLKNELKLIERVDDSSADPDETVCAAPACRWLDQNAFVVQCGDQVDGERHRVMPHWDVETVLFTDYLQEISNGNFMNVIGNHEWMNVTGNELFKRYVHEEDAKVTRSPTGNRRSELFRYDGVVGRFLRRRHMVLRINNALFSHAGICSEVLERCSESSDACLESVNALLDDDRNYDERTFTEEFQEVAWNNATGIMWTRAYNPHPKASNPSLGILGNGRDIVPASIADRIDLMVTGHNKINVPRDEVEWPGGMCIVVPDSTNKNKKKLIQACDKSTWSSHSECSIDKGTLTVALEGKKALLMSDVIRDDNFVTDTNPFQYAELVLDPSTRRFSSIIVRNYSCGRDKCERWPTKDCICEAMLA
jgi:hypothetical protein